MEARFDSHRALWAGIAFSLAFTALIWVTGTYWLEPRVLVPDRPGFFYEWQLLEPTFWSRATAWGGYLAHQVTIWALIWYAQQRRPRYTSGLHAFNVAALGATAFFITLRLLQTAFWYDGLAQDVHETSAQWSVIVVLVAVLLMENQRRGLVFGKKFNFVTEAGKVVRRYHGYYFAWATIYTFWYHPMESTSGHLFGFAYMFFLLMQGSLFFTRAHLNRYWTGTLELMVLAHAVMVAVMNGDGWPMFLTGFAGIFVVTQMHGFGLSQALRWFIGVAYIAMVGIVYGITGLERIGQVPLIPLTEFAGVLLLSGLVLGLARLAGRRPQTQAAPVSG